MFLAVSPSQMFKHQPGESDFLESCTFYTTESRVGGGNGDKYLENPLYRGNGPGASKAGYGQTGYRCKAQQTSKVKGELQEASATGRETACMRKEKATPEARCKLAASGAHPNLYQTTSTAR